jgi:hypothetical protein
LACVPDYLLSFVAGENRLLGFPLFSHPQKWGLPFSPLYATLLLRVLCVLHFSKIFRVEFYVF